jgi:hypothetical protein
VQKNHFVSGVSNLAYLVAGISGRGKTKGWCAGYGGRPAGRRSGIIAWGELGWIRVWEISDGTLVIIVTWCAYLITDFIEQYIGMRRVFAMMIYLIVGFVLRERITLHTASQFQFQSSG